MVLGKLTAEGIAKCQFGKSKITRNKETKAEISIGDDLKAAATDSIKKCATLFGIGLHLYFDSANGNGNGGERRSAPNPTPSNGEHQNGRLTAKQLSAIFSVAKAKGWSNKRVRDFAHEMFGKMPDFLSKKEASAVISHLQQAQDEGDAHA